MWLCEISDVSHSEIGRLRDLDFDEFVFLRRDADRRDVEDNKFGECCRRKERTEWIRPVPVGRNFSMLCVYGYSVFSTVRNMGKAW